jgi:hypothetical protein
MAYAFKKEQQDRVLELQKSLQLITYCLQLGAITISASQVLLLHQLLYLHLALPVPYL